MDSSCHHFHVNFHEKNIMAMVLRVYKYIYLQILHVKQKLKNAFKPDLVL
jgi:hypothetical protein